MGGRHRNRNRNRDGGRRDGHWVGFFPGCAAQRRPRAVNQVMMMRIDGGWVWGWPACLPARFTASDALGLGFTIAVSFRRASAGRLALQPDSASESAFFFVFFALEIHSNPSLIHFIEIGDDPALMGKESASLFTGAPILCHSAHPSL